MRRGEGNIEGNQRAFASKLSRWGINHGIKYRTDLADELDVPRPRINAWFKGVLPSRPYLRHLAEVTGDAGFLSFRGGDYERPLAHGAGNEKGGA